MKKQFLFLAVLLSFFCSCDVNYDDGKYAEQIVGTYTISSINSTLGMINPMDNDRIVVTRVNDKYVDVLIDYSSPTANDVSLDNVELSRAENGDIFLDKEYTNAMVTGEVEGSELSLNILYENEDFIDFVATK